MLFSSLFVSQGMHPFVVHFGVVLLCCCGCWLLCNGGKWHCCVHTQPLTCVFDNYSCLLQKTRLALVVCCAVGGSVLCVLFAVSHCVVLCCTTLLWPILLGLHAKTSKLNNTTSVRCCDCVVRTGVVLTLVLTGFYSHSQKWITVPLMDVVCVVRITPSAPSLVTPVGLQFCVWFCQFCTTIIPLASFFQTILLLSLLRRTGSESLVPKNVCWIVFVVVFCSSLLLCLLCCWKKQAKSQPTFEFSSSSTEN